jgi:hypothetical protein
MLMCSALPLGATWCTFGLFAVSISAVCGVAGAAGGYILAIVEGSTRFRVECLPTRRACSPSRKLRSTIRILTAGSLWRAMCTTRRPTCRTTRAGRTLSCSTRVRFTLSLLTRIRAVPPRLARARASSPLQSQTAVTPFPAPIPTLTPRARRAARRRRRDAGLQRHGALLVREKGPCKPAGGRAERGGQGGDGQAGKGKGGQGGGLDGLGWLRLGGRGPRCGAGLPVLGKEGRVRGGGLGFAGL